MVSVPFLPLLPVRFSLCCCEVNVTIYVCPVANLIHSMPSENSNKLPRDLRHCFMVSVGVPSKAFPVKLQADSIRDTVRERLPGTWIFRSGR